MSNLSGISTANPKSLPLSSSYLLCSHILSIFLAQCSFAVGYELNLPALRTGWTQTWSEMKSTIYKAQVPVRGGSHLISLQYGQLPAHICVQKDTWTPNLYNMPFFFIEIILESPCLPSEGFLLFSCLPAIPVYLAM